MWKYGGRKREGVQNRRWESGNKGCWGQRGREGRGEEEVDESEWYYIEDLDPAKVYKERGKFDRGCISPFLLAWRGEGAGGGGRGEVIVISLIILLSQEMKARIAGGQERPGEAWRGRHPLVSADMSPANWQRQPSDNE